MVRRYKQLAARAFPALAYQGCYRLESLELAFPEQHTHPEGIDRSGTPTSKAASTAFAFATLQHLTYSSSSYCLVHRMRHPLLQATWAVPHCPLS